VPLPPVIRPSGAPVVLELAEPTLPPPPPAERRPLPPALPAEAAALSPGQRDDAKARPPHLAQVAQMLRSPQGAAAAVVLREILDKPLCRRGPGIPARRGA
jgi:hypothetical protein